MNLSARIQNTNLRVNEAMDYALVLNSFDSMNCTYSLLLEDDAIISHNWFNRIQAALESSKLKNRHDWSYVKLFTGYKLFDWDFVWRPIILVKIIMFALFLFIVQYTIAYHLYPKRFSNISFFLIFANSVALVVVFNATSVNPVGAGIHEYTTGFGTVSVLVPRHRLTDISKFLIKIVNDLVTKQNDNFMPKDLLLDKFRRNIGDVEFVFEPSLVQHIGYYSSVYARDTSEEGYKRMFKSYSFLSHFRPIQFDLAYSQS